MLIKKEDDQTGRLPKWNRGESGNFDQAVHTPKFFIDISNSAGIGISGDPVSMAAEFIINPC